MSDVKFPPMPVFQGAGGMYEVRVDGPYTFGPADRIRELEGLVDELTAERDGLRQRLDCGGWRIEKTSCHCNREDEGHGWAVLFENEMVRCLGCLRDALDTSSPGDDQ